MNRLRSCWAFRSARLLLAPLVFATGACHAAEQPPLAVQVAPPAAATPSSAAREGRLTARPRPGLPGSPESRGVQPLGLAEGRDGLLYVPASLAPETPAALVVLLHGAGGNARDTLRLLRDRADAEGFLLLVPESRGTSWDIIRGGYGPDVAFLDRALAAVFARYAVAPERVMLAGFSDGASYALSLGVMNGELFRHVVAFSPGFMAPRSSSGRPRIYVSHGTRDTVLPIDPCSRRLVPRLRGDGYEVLYREFDGPHTVPAEVVREALAWLRASPT